MSKALVVLSGGQDSVTCLYWAKQKFDEVETITFDYGQRHNSEIEAAVWISGRADVGVRTLLDLRPYGACVSSALTDKSIPVDASGGVGGLPSTFTPGRNLVFLTVAASVAVSKGIYDVVTGVCQTDYSGYPDCREETIKSLEATINLGIGAEKPVTIHTPLMHMTKAETVKLAQSLPGCMDALARTVTCYHGKRPGCGECPSCILRAKGFKEAGVADPACS